MIFSVFLKIWVFGYSWSTLLWYRCYYPHRSRDALSPVCGIFSAYLLVQSQIIPVPRPHSPFSFDQNLRLLKIFKIWKGLRFLWFGIVTILKYVKIPKTVIYSKQFFERFKTNIQKIQTIGTRNKILEVIWCLIEQNFCPQLLRIQWTNRVQFAVITSWKSLQDITGRLTMLVHWMLFFTMYLI